MFLVRKTTKISGHKFRFAKLVRANLVTTHRIQLTFTWQLIIFAFAAVELSLFVLWCRSSLTERTQASIASASLSFVDALAFLPLSYLEHSKSLRPSAILNVYLFFSIIFDAIRVRTMWLIENKFNSDIAVLFTMSFCLKSILLVLEAWEKKRYLSDRDRTSYSPEETSGALAQGLFVWLNRLILDGATKALSVDDLYPLDHEMITEKLYAKFQDNWDQCGFHRAYPLW